MKNTLFGKNIITVETLSKKDLNLIFKKTDQMRELVKKKGRDERLKGKILAALFYEPSSRTFSSFIAAMQRLGGGFIPLNDMSKTSEAKGETLEDTVRVFSAYANVLVIRHPKEGSLDVAVRYAKVPVINAGDGIGEHPTQAILDLYTLREHFGKFDNLHIAFLGDLRHYRPVNSLAKLMTLYPKVKMSFVSPAEVSLQSKVKKYLKKKNIVFEELVRLDKIISNIDVLYVTRVKKEYMSQELYKKVKGKYVIDGKEAKKMKKQSIIMHPLPRVGEITEEVDSDARAVYLGEQLKSGLYVRMALLDLILRK